MNLKIEYLPIDQIRPYAGNAKKHTQDQIEQIKESILKFGFNDPIGIWKGEIVEGHGRYIAANELNLKQVPVIKLDNLTDEQRRAYNIIHNKLTLDSDFNNEILKEELHGIIDIDMTKWNFKSEILSDKEILEDILTDEEIEEKEKQPKSYICPCCGKEFQINK